MRKRLPAEVIKLHRLEWIRKYGKEGRHIDWYVRYYALNKDRVLERQKKRRRIDGEKIRIREKELRIVKRAVLAKQRANRYAELKEAAINNYSNGAACCLWCGQADIDVLCLDHIHDDGNHGKAPNNSKNNHVYRWVYSREYPPGFQVLCANCNMKKEMIRKRRVREEWLKNV